MTNNTATKDNTATKARRPTKKVAAPLKVDTRGQIQVRLPQDLIDRLDIEAEKRRVSKTFLVEQMIASSLPKWEEQDVSPV